MLVRSAGFLLAGESSPSLLLDALGEHGIDGSHHRSNKVDVASLRAADLVLTMEGDHVQRATLLHREAFPKIMPLTEAAAAMRENGPMDPSELVAAINQDRDPASYLSTTWDVDDPYRRKLKDYRRAVVEISGLVDDVVGRLA